MDTPEQARALMQTIEQEAKDRWGDNWIASLTNAYCAIEGEETGTRPTAPNRRSQVVGALESANPKLETLLRLAKAVEVDVELAITKRKRL